MPRRSAMRHVIIFATLVFLVDPGSALAENSPGPDYGPSPHAIDVREPSAADAPEDPPQEEAPPKKSEQPIGATKPAQPEPPTEEPEQLLDAAELDQLVAPIALYPDPLLAQVLIASTYPLEVVEADRFVKANKTLKGDALKAELVKQDWDDSVKALVEAPEILAMMSAELDWMQSLGDAVLAQQPDVMEAVQRLRAKAEASGKLASTEQQRVVVSEEAGQREIVIQPASPEIVYVPYYQPSVVYGPWPYPSHPPYTFAPPPRYTMGQAIATGIAFGVGYAISNVIFDSFDWRHRHIRVYRPRDAHFNRNVYGHRREIYRSNWQHNAYHRRGVNYKNASVWRKYAKGDKARPKPGFAARPKPGKPPKAVYEGKGGPPQIAKGKGGGKGKSADAKGRAKPKGVAKKKNKKKKKKG